jgi:hypothetical protein
VSVTLTANVGADDRLLLVTGDTSAAELGHLYRIDDEVVLLFEFDRYVVVAGRRRVGRDPSRWHVHRGAADSAVASHTAGAEIEAVSAALIAGDDLTPPDPFAGAGDAFNGGTITEPLVVATGSGEVPLSLQPHDVEVLAVDEWGQITLTQIVNGRPLSVVDSDGNLILQITEFGQTTFLNWQGNGNVIALLASESAGTPHLISFDTHDEDGSSNLDLGNVAVTDYSTGAKQSVMSLTTSEDGGFGRLWGEGRLELYKPAEAISAFIVANDIDAGADRLTVAKNGATVHQLATGASLTVKDNANAAIFRIDADGSVHIKTGTTIQADL